MTTAITLTYPIEVKSVIDAKRLNRDRDVFIKAYKRQYGNNVRYVWMKELQANGNPHYHLMTDCQADVKDQEWFIRNTWYEIVGSDLIKHFYNGVYCDKIRVSQVMPVTLQNICRRWMSKKAYLPRSARLAGFGVGRVTPLRSRRKNIPLRIPWKVSGMPGVI